VRVLVQCVYFCRVMLVPPLWQNPQSIRWRGVRLSDWGSSLLGTVRKYVFYPKNSPESVHCRGQAPHWAFVRVSSLRGGPQSLKVTSRSVNEKEFRSLLTGDGNSKQRRLSFVGGEVWLFPSGRPVFSILTSSCTTSNDRGRWKG